MEMIPAELWMQIAMSDPRIYNALARVSRAIAMCLNAKAARELFESCVEVVYRYPEGYYASEWKYFASYPTLGGLVHTFHQPNITVGLVGPYAHNGAIVHTVASSYGKLMQSVEGSPSFWFSCCDSIMKIYADKGVITRDDGPAVVFKFGLDLDANGVEIHIKDGKVTKMRALLTDGTELEIVEIDFNTSNMYLLTLDVDWSATCQLLNDCIHSTIDTVIETCESDIIDKRETKLDLNLLSEQIMRITDAVATLGTDIPAIFENAHVIADLLIATVNSVRNYV